MRKLWPFLLLGGTALGWLAFYQWPATDARFASYVVAPGQQFQLFYHGDQGRRG